MAPTKRMRVKTGFEALEGCRGVAVTPLKPYGEVRVEGEFWRARAEEGEIEEGSEIIV
ncbi:MAG TPA: nodulation protein NfeD, partial [Candidatus Bathyarchaeota archaeon]|nr:nodulation protein NfeD [Candidatus Bathyarchaeota archaeon]